ncbi:THAP domain-containing protein 10-like isoform X2 [Rhipicephalus sanguineus]|uniref:THAP domain-containing protein 10-like isoform X2 n=1 Tax=Rhipicephalus sanguineus TaxID=34632 RepID=UPI001894F167|nr:THAP domain-containing protein 10-like isoform X2 [Rhipicephalus sanguineus]
MAGTYCVVDFCTTKQYGSTPMHKFPTETSQRQQWIDFVRATGRKDWVPSKSSRICARHFETSCYVTVPECMVKLGFSPGRAQLQRGAIPSIYPDMCSVSAASGSISRKRPCYETCSDRGHEPDLPLHMPTHLCASGNDKATTAGCFVANVHTQCHVEVGIRGTQAALKPASRSTGVQTRLTVLPVEAVLKATQVALKRASRSTGGQTRPRVFCVEVDMEDAKVVLKPASRSTDVHTRSTDVHTRSADVHTRPTVVWLKSSTPCPKPSLVCSEPSPTNKDDPQDETYKPKFNSSEAH